MTETRVVSSFVAHTWLCDHFGHLNVRHYAGAFDDATFIFWDGIGFRPGDGRPMPVTLEVKTAFKHEALAGTVGRITAVVTKVGQKSVGLRFDMHDAEGTLLASCDVIEVFMDATSRQSCAIPDALRNRLEAYMTQPLV
ncbi:acyl-CoA thioesterase [Fuscibacter oryzae]|uniref:Thioesterase family protein n=1 Tax=Fuscibacter oryzae TaxID=2803939 RepID=A0A8J7MV09_9RHOB|nr:thioesterase family protein [Fuscibacter oryzae]MBL4928988.1 thioesterase family protein [Fuscibacter oryzae]